MTGAGRGADSLVGLIMRPGLEGSRVSEHASWDRSNGPSVRRSAERSRFAPGYRIEGEPEA